MKILLIGASGQLGTDLKKILHDGELYCPSSTDLDITKFTDVKEYIGNHHFDVVINTAAFHNVDKCELEPRMSFLVNTLAVKNLAEICKENDSVLAHYSTDYVFSGNKTKTPYATLDTPIPVNIYGISKLAGSEVPKGTEKSINVVWLDGSLVNGLIYFFK